MCSFECRSSLAVRCTLDAHIGVSEKHFREQCVQLCGRGIARPTPAGIVEL